MQTLIFLLLTFLLVIFSVLLYLKNKTSRVDRLNSGECPTCGEKAKIFYDEVNKTQFRNEVITKRVLKNHGCSGAVEIEYRCKSCGLKEVHAQSSNSGCGM